MSRGSGAAPMPRRGIRGFPCIDARLPCALLLSLAAAGCSSPASHTSAAAPPVPEPPAQLIDPSIPPATAGQGGWKFQQTARADLDGDGREERVVLTARVEQVRGRVAWDDRQPWQVYVEAPDGRRTRLYARHLQIGTLTLRVSAARPGQPATVILLEHLPDHLAVHEARYAGPGRASVVTRFYRALDPRGETASPRFP